MTSLGDQCVFSEHIEMPDCHVAVAETGSREDARKQDVQGADRDCLPVSSADHHNVQATGGPVGVSASYRIAPLSGMVNVSPICCWTKMTNGRVVAYRLENARRAGGECWMRAMLELCWESNGQRRAVEFSCGVIDEMC